MSGADI